ncbi:MAG TPA: DUF4292 domain-containing protein [Bacteroidetes bacterium]|nr:DUF4292 domain-containing protein [Bacteroidota bacterium]
MNKHCKIILLFFLPVVMLAVSSCKSTRATLKEPLKMYGFNYLYSKMLENQMDFQYLNARFGIEYKQGKKTTSLHGQLRIKNDSIIWISFSPALGIEAARVVMTNDSVKFINRLNKTYFTGEYLLLGNILNTTIDYSILQSMIIGNDLTQYDVSKYRASIDGGLYRITIQERKKIKKYLKSNESNSKILVQNIWLDPGNFKIEKIELKELGGDNKKLDVLYNDYQEINGRFFPMKLLIHISSQKPVTISVNFQKVELNKPLKFPFSISRKYEELLITDKPHEK